MPTLDQYMTGIANAERAGDKEAAEFLRREAQKQMVGTGSFMEKLGAGVQDIVLGTKQLAGQTTPEEVREHNRIASMATGDTLGGNLTRGLAYAPLAFVPGAATIPGAAALGAAQGVLTPTEDENVLAGKVKNAALGGALGGA